MPASVLIGLVIAVVGVVLMVQGIQGNRALLRTLGGGVVVVGALFALLTSSFVIVPAGHVGVVFNIFGGIQDDELNEGVHIVLPVLQQVILYDVRQREVTLARETGDEIAGRSSEGLEIISDVTVIYQVRRDQAARLHQDIGADYQQVRLRPVIRSKIRDAVANYRAADLISVERARLQREIEESMTTELERDNIIVRNVLLRDVRIPQSITTAIEEKQAAEQQVEVEENRRRQSEISAQRRVIEAEGERDAEIARAEGEAEALRVRGIALRDNPEIIQLEVAQRLSASLQTIMIPTEGNFLLDMRGIAGMNSLPPSANGSATQPEP